MDTANRVWPRWPFRGATLIVWTGYLAIGHAEGARGGHRRSAPDDRYFWPMATMSPTHRIRGRDGRNAHCAGRDFSALSLCAVSIRRSRRTLCDVQNQLPLGLGSGVWTQDIGKAHRVARAMRAGMVWINCYQVTDPAVAVRRLQDERPRTRIRPWHMSRNSSTSRP